MKAYALALCVVLVGGCQSTQPTYVDIPTEQLQAIAEQFGTDVEGLFATHTTRLKAELSEELGMKVQKLFEDEDLDGKLDALQPELRRIVAEIQPASEAAIDAAGEKVADDPTNPTNWVGAGTAAGGILLAGLLGLRGRKKRRKEAASNGSTNTPA